MTTAELPPREEAGNSKRDETCKLQTKSSIKLLLQSRYIYIIINNRNRKSEKASIIE